MLVAAIAEVGGLGAGLLELAGSLLLAAGAARRVGRVLDHAATGPRQPRGP